jgi:hypothetical protein
MRSWESYNAPLDERSEALEAALGPPGTECCQGGRRVAPLCTGCPDLAHPRRDRQRALHRDEVQEDEGT